MTLFPGYTWLKSQSQPSRRRTCRPRRRPHLEELESRCVPSFVPPVPTHFRIDVPGRDTAGTRDQYAALLPIHKPIPGPVTRASSDATGGAPAGCRTSRSSHGRAGVPRRWRGAGTSQALEWTICAHLNHPAGQAGQWK